MRSPIFIGSSSEGLKYLQTVKDQLEAVGDIVSWTNSFALNENYLDSLIKKTKLTEFAILIATRDDTTIKRGKKKLSPRDNIIFEFGLFMGATGVSHSFLLAEEGTDLPSDLNGIELAWFSADAGKPNSLEKMCGRIADRIKAIQESSHLGLLPSTALAIGYYNSFLKGVCEQLRDNNLITLADGSTIKVKNFELHVIIPNELDANGLSDFTQLYNKNNGLERAQTAVLSKAKRDYPFHFKIDPADQDRAQDLTVKLFDVPTTLNTITESIRLFLPTGEVGQNADLDYLERRELENFAKVLRYYIGKNSLTRASVTVVSNVVL